MASLPKLWNNSTCFILGGGPSLIPSDIPLLEGKRVIAVNAAFHIAPWADVCWFGDARFHDWNIWDLVKFQGLKITCARRQKWPPGIIQVNRSRQMFGIDQNRDRIAWNRNSGASALNLAYHLGARRIVLIGYDMRLVDDKHNWHEYHKSIAPKDVYEKRFIQGFSHIKTAFDKLGIECVNTCVDSAIEEFPYMPFEEALQW